MAADATGVSPSAAIGRRSCPSMGRSRARLRGARRQARRLDAAVPADSLDDLGDGRQEAREVGRPAGDQLRIGGERGQEPVRRGRDRLRAPSRRRRSRSANGHRTRPRPASRARPRRRPPARCRARPAWRCALRSSRRAARSRPAGRRATGIRGTSRRDAGCPTRPPCARAAAIVSTGVRPGGMASWRKTQMRSPSVVLTSSPTITVNPSGAARLGFEGAVDPVVVRDRDVGQPALGGQPDDVRRASTGNRSWRACGSAGR